MNTHRNFSWETRNQGILWQEISHNKNRQEKQEIDEGNVDKIKDEFGDFIFSLINYSRFLKINPEDSLERTNKKFIKRFNFIESKASELGKKISDLSLEEMEFLWQKVKRSE